LRPTPPNNHPSQATAQFEGAQKSNPFIGAVRSKKSALDIENDLFAGIKIEAPEPEDFSKESPDMINSLVSAFGRDFLGTSESTSVSDATGFTTSHSKLAQPFRMPQNVIRGTLAQIRKSEANNKFPTATNVKTIPQFQFMSARAAPAEVERSNRSKRSKRSNNRTSTLRCSTLLNRE
jgi:recombination DNA repair RAD52 pathway protein